MGVHCMGVSQYAIMEHEKEKIRDGQRGTD